MKAKLIAALAVATLASAATALADDTTTPSTSPPSTSPPSTSPSPTTSTSTTTTTAADVNESVTPVAPTSGPPRGETVTLYDKHRPNKVVLGVGSAIFLGTYATTAAVTAANIDSNDRSMYIPVVGPWLALKDETNFDTGKTLLYAGSGVLQGAGLGLAIASFFIPEKTAAVTIQAKNVKMNVTPTASAGGGGIGAVGTF